MRDNTGQFATNRKAFFNYEILEKFEAGIELLGFEVKSIRNGKCSLDGSHITVRGNEIFLIGANIAPYQATNTPKSYAENRNRRLLITKKEINEISNIESKKGLTIVPLSVYDKSGKIKVQIAVVRGKKKFDKRETMQKRAAVREADRIMKGH